MKVILLKACEYSAPMGNGRQTMVGIFDNIVVPHIPIDHPPFSLCAQVEFDQADSESDHQVFCRLIDPDAQTLFDVALNINHPRDPNGGSTRVFISISVPGLRLEKLGDHRLELKLDGLKMGEETIPVLQVMTQPIA